MLDFLRISTRQKKQGHDEIYPKFIIKKSEDLMIRGGDFYAVWVEENGMWSTEEQDVFKIIDSELEQFTSEYKIAYPEKTVHTLYMWDSDSGMVDSWHKYCQKQMRDCYHQLDDRLIFASKNGRTKRTDYASKTLSYALEPGDYSAYEKLISTLYSEKERHKIEWVIGAIVSGDSKHIQKFMVLYGSAGTGKSTILNIIQMLFDGYWATFDAEALGSSNGVFALEPLKNNPLVAIQHDGDLSRIEKNTRLNSLVSHEQMTVNEKHKNLYSTRFNCFLLMGTNKPVKITDAKSGLIRRLIDVSPSGNTLSPGEYELVMNQIPFELGAIASHCLEVYKNNKNYYNKYIPTNMMGASNDFYNFVEDSYLLFKKEDGTTLKAAWEMYRTYCTEANVPYQFSKRVFKEELKNYFNSFEERYLIGDNTRVRNYYSGFKSDKFETSDSDEDEPILYSIDFKDHTEQMSNFELVCRDCPAQYANDEGKPINKWSKVKTTLGDIDTTLVHYVKPPESHIVIDFDIPDEEGNKSYESNLRAASKWPKTYAELSKSGAGIHLHYIYTGDPTKLRRVYRDHVEVKVFTGNSSLRRKLTKCNDLPVATISSGLPLKGEKMVNQNVIKNERGLRTLIMKNLNKEVHPATKPSVDFIFKILDDAYNSGMKYDVTDLRNAIMTFAAGSTNQAEYCLKLISKMKFKSDEPSEPVDANGGIAFFDIEVFPNLTLVCWKEAGEGKQVVRMFNPSPSAIEALLSHKLIGFNCRRYDNHIVYALLLGYSPEQCYNISQKIVSGDRNAFFGEAYNLSYTDIYDFASAGNKKSLKKLEIDMGIHHQELGLPWDQPVDTKLWDKVGDYCENDVIATEAAFSYLKADWTAREILSDLAEMTVNDTTNTLTTRIIFGKNRTPQSDFCYRDMSEIVDTIDVDVLRFLRNACPDMIGEHVPSFVSCADTAVMPFTSVLPYFPAYTYEAGQSIYRGESVGEGGYVYATEGIHTNVALLDVVSMHPHSLIAECLLGPKYTKIFRDLVEARVAIKHENWPVAEKMLDGKLAPYIEKVKAGEMTSKDLANALKTAINSVYGLTAASFDNPFRDKRNKDNIVAKRGALFMVDLKYEVAKRGFTVAHIKTDSIKIPDATPEIIKFVMEFGRKYGYEFEHEATYEKMCLVNDAVYIAKYASAEWCQDHYGYLPEDNKKKAGKWTATGTQFQVPYVFKTLFSHEPIEFDDMCETKSVTTALYLDMNESMPDVSDAEKELEKLQKEHKKLKKQWEEENIRDGSEMLEDLDNAIASCELDIARGHKYVFVGRVGQFCPVKEGVGGGRLVREKDGKFYAVGGTKNSKGVPYRWLESEMIKNMNWSDMINKEYYEDLVDKAVEAISKHGDFEWFVS